MDVESITSKLLSLKDYLNKEGSVEAVAMLEDIINSLVKDRKVSGDIKINIAARGIGKHILEIKLMINQELMSKTLNFDDEDFGPKIKRLINLFRGQKINISELKNDEELVKEILNLVNNAIYVKALELTNGDVNIIVGETSVTKRIVNDFISKIT
jgi:hypothetical protein